MKWHNETENIALRNQAKSYKLVVVVLSDVVELPDALLVE
jgi:hypothetical protein